MSEDLFQKLADSWPCPVVARSEVSRFSGGILHPRTLANIDARGEGPGKASMGRKVFYDRDSLISWMKSRSGTAAGR